MQDLISVLDLPFPATLHYHIDYNVWLRLEPDDSVLLGITAYACAMTGELFSFVPKTPGLILEAGRSIGIVEFRKTAGAVKTPLPGTLLAVNGDVTRQPNLVNADPYGAGWLARIAPRNWRLAAASLVTGAAIEPAFVAQMARDGYPDEVRDDAA